MKRVLVSGLLLACALLAGCAAALIGGGGQAGGPEQRCDERNRNDCDR